ncbi:MAG: response regulator transcription factor [Bacteroidales bacterium]|nr:response regulator transcription factor [Bacteroidales bacterium]
MDKIKLILVDDHQVVIDGIVASLMLYDDIEVIAEASDGKELFKKLETFSPDIIILDIAMPDITGIEICKILKKDFPEIKVIIFTGDENQDSIFKALKAGANAFLPKETQREELVSTIYAVNKGEKYISNSISNTLIIDYLEKEKKTNKYSKKKVTLSEREIEILTCIAEGLPYKIIADKLFISTKTVEKHKRNILNKLDLESTVDLVKYAIKNNIIDF